MVGERPSCAPPDVSPASLRREVEALCALGNRFVGTPGEAAAATHIARRLRDAGAEPVRLEPVDTLAYVAVRAVIEVPSMPGMAFPAVGLQFTRSGDVEAPGAYLGTPRSLADVEALISAGVEVKGRVVVVQSYWPYLLAPYLADAGAAGIVVVSPVPDGLIAHFTAHLYPPAEAPGFAGTPLPLPGVTVERDAGGLLAAIAGRGLPLRVCHRARYEPGRSSNVVGIVPGVECQDELVVLGAHFDTQADGVGACDNASGVAALIELARACAARPRRRSVVFVAFAAEEQGFRGSLAYCRRHVDAMPRTRAMVCLDALAWRYPGRRAVHGDLAMLDFAAERAAEAGWPVDERVDASLLRGSDHNPFIDAGVPAAWFWHYPPQHPYYHSAGDVPDLVDFDAAAVVASVAGHTAFSVADARTDVLGRSRPITRWLDLRAAVERPSSEDGPSKLKRPGGRGPIERSDLEEGT